MLANLHSSVRTLGPWHSDRILSGEGQYVMFIQLLTGLYLNPEQYLSHPLGRYYIDIGSEISHYLSDDSDLPHPPRRMHWWLLWLQEAPGIVSAQSSSCKKIEEISFSTINTICH